MKIEVPNTLRIRSAPDLQNRLKGLKIGSEISARILDRPTSREAILEIGGTRLRAEFLRGIPQNNHIMLRLEESRDSSMLFKLIEPDHKENFLKEILKFTIFDGDAAKHEMIYSLSKFLGRSPAGIFELNAFICDLNTKEKKREGLDQMLNRLMALGFSKDSLNYLSLMLSGMNANPKIYMMVLLLLGYRREDFQRWALESGKEIEDRVDAILAGLDDVKDKTEKEKILSVLIDLLSRCSQHPGDFNYGEIALYDDEELMQVRCMGKDDSWIFSIHLSQAGRVDILAQKIKNGLVISVFASQDNFIESFNSDQNLLRLELQKIADNIHINIYKMDNIINKIVEINSYYTINRLFDIKA